MPMDQPAPTFEKYPDFTTNPSLIIIPVAVAVPATLLLLLVVVIAVALILKHHISHHTAKKASHTTTSHTHPPAAAPVGAVSLCEETGQVHYASLDQDTHTYASIPPQADKGRAGPYEEQEGVGGCSTLHHGNKPAAASGTEDPPFYAQIDEKPKEKKNKSTGKKNISKCVMQAMAVKFVDVEDKQEKADSELETIMNQLYAQADKKPKKNKKKLTFSNTPQLVESVANPLYAGMDKQKEADAESPMDQFYAQVDKKSDVCAEESGAVYSVVN